MKLSVIIPTCGRPSLQQTLASLASQPMHTTGPDADEVVIVGQAHRSAFECAALAVQYFPCRIGHHWGCEERTLGIAKATGTHLAFIDDDDWWLPGARAAIADAMATTPTQPVLFKMRYGNGSTLWDHPRVQCGSVSTQMILIPNDPARLGRWTTRREGDYDFLASMKWPSSDIVWRTEVIAYIGASR